MREFGKVRAEIDDCEEKQHYAQGIDRIHYVLRCHGDVLDKSEKSWLYERLALFLSYCGDMKASAEAFRQYVMQAPSVEEQKQAYSNYLFECHYLDDLDDGELANRHFRYGKLFHKEQEFQHDAEKHRCHEKIRVGYISTNFKEHVMNCFMLHLLAYPDRERFDVYCYDLWGNEDETTEQLKSFGNIWRTLASMGTWEKAKAIYDDEIDILFDFSGHSDGGHGLLVAGYKPAPLQISGIGYMSTTGLPAMDYYLSDVHLDPLGSGEKYFSEKLLRLPSSHLCYLPFKEVYEARLDYRVHQPIVFGCFNKTMKITERMLALWLEILRRVPGAKLLLKAYLPEKASREFLLKKARAVGYAPEQIEIRPMRQDYAAEYMDMDIALDTYPYTGGGMTCVALYMGVPVVTLAGTRHGARFGLSLLENVGIGELVAQNEQEYIEKAVALAHDKELLTALHAQLRPMMQASPLMDGRNYVREMEAAYERIWGEWIA